jgi:hypothetical protein
MAEILWQASIQTLENAYAPRDPIPYIVGGLFALPSLNIIYGAPGCMKSLLLQDMAVCVAAGIPWLERWPYETSTVSPYQVIRAPVLWVDLDNGRARTDNRFEAIGRAHQAAADIPLYYVSMPTTPLDLRKPDHTARLIELVQFKGAKLVTIDNLANISGGADENTSEMLQVMFHLRQVVEYAGATVNVIHHSRKDNGFRGKSGDNMRGFSGIRGAIDTGLYIDRDPHADEIYITAEKVRDVDIDPFGAMWTFTNKPGFSDLETGKFFRIAAKTPPKQQQRESIQEAVLQVLQSIKPGWISQNALKTKVKTELENNGSKNVGLNTIENVIKSMGGNGQIRSSVLKNGRLIEYSC